MKQSGRVSLFTAAFAAVSSAHAFKTRAEKTEQSGVQPKSKEGGLVAAQQTDLWLKGHRFETWQSVLEQGNGAIKSVRTRVAKCEMWILFPHL